MNLEDRQNCIFIITNGDQNIGLLELLGVGYREAVGLKGVHLEITIHHVDET